VERPPAGADRVRQDADQCKRGVERDGREHLPLAMPVLEVPAVDLADARAARVDPRRQHTDREREHAEDGDRDTGGVDHRPG
jgi:hypothetical protein